MKNLKTKLSNIKGHIIRLGYAEEKLNKLIFRLHTKNDIPTNEEIDKELKWFINNLEYDDDENS